MNRNEVTERIVKRLTDPWDADFSTTDVIDLTEAARLIEDLRRDDELAGLTGDDRLPDEATPETVMTAYNCLVRKAHHDERITLLAELLTNNEDVQIYNELRDSYLPDGTEVLPVEYFAVAASFPFEHGLSFPTYSDYVEIGMNSVNTFKYTDEYCWFDAERLQLYSSNTPFVDGIIDAVALATYIIETDTPEVWETVRENAYGYRPAYEVIRTYGT